MINDLMVGRQLHQTVVQHELVLMNLQKYKQKHAQYQPVNFEHIM